MAIPFKCMSIAYRLASTTATGNSNLTAIDIVTGKGNGPGNYTTLLEHNGPRHRVAQEIKAAKIDIQTSTSPKTPSVGETIKYTVAVTNNGNIDANDVSIKDALSKGLKYVEGSLDPSKPASGDPNTGITLDDPIAPGETVLLTYDVLVEDVPTPNPVPNKVTADYNFIADEVSQEVIPKTATGDPLTVSVFRYNLTQQVNDIIQSVAQEQAALANIANAEAAKIEELAKRDNVTPQELLCINKSVSETLESIVVLEGILKQKLNLFNCRINQGKC